MILKCIPTGMFSSNCYIIGNNGEGVVIDAGADSRDVMEAADKSGLKVRYIILTHTHIDHICCVDDICKAAGAQVMVHELDSPALSNPMYNGSVLFGSAETFKNADRFVKDREVFEAGGLKLEIIHTPGHTPGGICIKTGNCIFTGDTLFRESIGRTDLGNGDYNDIIHSIKNRLMIYDDNTVIYPGHGESTTVGHEKRNNPCIK